MSHAVYKGNFQSVITVKVYRLSIMYFIFNIRATDPISLIRLRFFILGILMCIYIEKTSNPVLVYCMHCLQSLFV